LPGHPLEQTLANPGNKTTDLRIAANQNGRFVILRRFQRKLSVPANKSGCSKPSTTSLLLSGGFFSRIRIFPPNAPLMGPTPISNIASNSSVPTSVNLLQPGVHTCSDCGSVNKSHTAWIEAGNMKRPSIFMYQFHRRRIIRAQSLNLYLITLSRHFTLSSNLIARSHSLAFKLICRCVA
jgi:hypothetical protein